MARDVRALVEAGALRAPLVISGASFGGLTGRVYAGMYPGDVAGMVLIDSSHVDERDSIPPAGEIRYPNSVFHAWSVVAMGLWRVGVARFVVGDDEPGVPDKGLSAEEWRVMRTFSVRGFAEFQKVPFLECLRQARAAKPMVGKPLVVLTAGLPMAVAENPVEARANLASQKRWVEAQKQLLRYSDVSRQVVVESPHCIQCVKPEAIVEAIREVVDRARRSPSSSQPWAELRDLCQLLTQGERNDVLVVPQRLEMSRGERTREHLLVDPAAHRDLRRGVARQYTEDCRQELIRQQSLIGGFDRSKLR